MLVPAVMVWTIILVLAFVNGALRELVLVPRLGSLAGHQVSALLLSAAIVLVTFIAIGRLQVASALAALAVGGLWLVMTLGFEFGAGHYLFHRPWDTLLADYRILEGRLWIVVLLVTLLSPVVAFWTSTARSPTLP